MKVVKYRCSKCLNIMEVLDSSTDRTVECTECKSEFLLAQSMTKKVWHMLVKDGKNLGHHNSDLQYDEGIPYVVFEWLMTHEGEVPSVRVPLDPKYLHEGNFGKADYLYELPVVWPKR